jgi:hypothetical protein
MTKTSFEFAVHGSQFSVAVLKTESRTATVNCELGTVSLKPSF